MTKPVITATTLVTNDGVPIEAIHLPGAGDLAIVVAHGFTLSWQRPNVWRIANRFNRRAGVFTFDFRGHGRSGGLSTLGDREIKDLEVVVAWARQLGYQRIAAVGFSMGASIVLRHAGLIGGLDAVVSVSGPGRWYYRGTEAMRRVHYAAEHRVGRFVVSRWLKTRISPEGWKLVPVSPAEAAVQISPVPLLIVHGAKDHYFPPEHARQLYRAAREPKDLWLLPDMGHAEAGCSSELVDRIYGWIAAAVAPGRISTGSASEPGGRSANPASPAIPATATSQATPNAAALTPYRLDALPPGRPTAWPPYRLAVRYRQGLIGQVGHEPLSSSALTDFLRLGNDVYVALTTLPLG